MSKNRDARHHHPMPNSVQRQHGSAKYLVNTDDGLAIKLFDKSLNVEIHTIGEENLQFVKEKEWKMTLEKYRNGQLKFEQLQSGVNVDAHRALPEPPKSSGNNIGQVLVPISKDFDIEDVSYNSETKRNVDSLIEKEFTKLPPPKVPKPVGSHTKRAKALTTAHNSSNIREQDETDPSMMSLSRDKNIPEIDESLKIDSTTTNDERSSTKTHKKRKSLKSSTKGLPSRNPALELSSDSLSPWNNLNTTTKRVHQNEIIPEIVGTNYRIFDGVLIHKAETNFDITRLDLVNEETTLKDEQHTSKKGSTSSSTTTSTQVDENYRTLADSVYIFKNKIPKEKRTKEFSSSSHEVIQVKAGSRKPSLTEAKPASKRMSEHEEYPSFEMGLTEDSAGESSRKVRSKIIENPKVKRAGSVHHHRQSTSEQNTRTNRRGGEEVSEIDDTLSALKSLSTRKGYEPSTVETKPTLPSLPEPVVKAPPPKPPPQSPLPSKGKTQSPHMLPTQHKVLNHQHPSPSSNGALMTSYELQMQQKHNQKTSQSSTSDRPRPERPRSQDQKHHSNPDQRNAKVKRAKRTASIDGEIFGPILENCSDPVIMNKILLRLLNSVVKQKAQERCLHHQIKLVKYREKLKRRNASHCHRTCRHQHHHHSRETCRHHHVHHKQRTNENSSKHHHQQTPEIPAKF